MAETAKIPRNKMVAELVRSPHGALSEYLDVGRTSASDDPEFFAHLVAWNRANGQVRDAKVALPLIAIDSLVPKGGKPPAVDDAVFLENAMAHLILLPARDLARGLDWGRAEKLAGRRQTYNQVVRHFFLRLEGNEHRWNRVALQHRRSLKRLYSLYHVKPADFAEDVLFKDVREPGSVFDAVSRLQKMDPLEAASEVLRHRIPFLIAAPALGKKLQDPAVLVQLIQQMSPNELTSHMKMLERLGVRKDPMTRAALEIGLSKVQESGSNAIKLGQAADAVEDEDLRQRITAVRERKLDKSSIEGNWLILADKSGSMQKSIDVARLVADVLSRSVSGKVHLVFFDDSAAYYDVTGKSLAEIGVLTGSVRPSGSTSIGWGLSYARARKLSFEGIAIVSDGGENAAPYFVDEYAKLGEEPTVYLYHVEGDHDRLSVNCKAAKIDLQKFEVSGADYYSLPNLVPTMRTNRYSLTDEIMETPLLTLSQVVREKAMGA